jgi:hypothetical protein
MKKGIINIIVYVVVFLAIQLACQSAANGLQALLHPETKGDISFTAIVIAFALSAIISIAVFLLLRWAEVSPNYLRTRPWAVCCWCALASIGTFVPSIFIQEHLPELPNISEDLFNGILLNRWGYVTVGLLVPIAEELVFRGAVLRELLRLCSRHWTAILLSALIFALIHGNPAQMPHAFVMGLLLGWMYWRTDSILPGVVFHWVNNSVAYVMYNIYPDPTLQLADIFGGSQRAVISALAFSLCILLPSLYQLYLRLRRQS